MSILLFQPAICLAANILRPLMNFFSLGNKIKNLSDTNLTFNLEASCINLLTELLTLFMQKSDAENAIYESARNRKYGKPRLYKQVTMYVVCCLVLICIRLRLQ